jgi:plastocyanin
MTGVFALALTHPGAAQGCRRVEKSPMHAAAAFLQQTAAGSPAPAAPAADAKQQQVAIDNFSFAPRTLTVPVGATVTWTNKDDIPHTVVSTKKRFASPALDTDQQFSYRFTAPGTYPYYCSVHPMMTGTVVVTK